MESFLALKHPWFYCKRKWHKFRSRLITCPGGSFVGKLGQINFAFEEGRRYEKIYQGQYQYALTQVVKKYVKKDGVFIDAGANIGYVSALAAHEIGPGGQIHCFEPVPDYFARLVKLKELNPACTFHLNNMALSDKADRLKIYVHSANIGGSSLIDGFIKDGHVKNKVDVAVNRLDAYLEEKAITRISLIKIDTEGYEWNVLNGCSRFFEKNRASLPPILVEVSRKGLHLLNSSPAQLQSYMAFFGYHPFCIFGVHPLDLNALADIDDVLFLAR